MEIKTNVDYLKSVRCADVYTESSVDYVLPDYLGDVRKILFSEAVLRPSGRFAGGDEVEFSGIVVYNLVYLDSDGGLSSVEFTSDYDYSVKCSGENYNDSIADTRVSNFAVRLVGPRKINAKASLVGSVRLSEKSSHSLLGDAFEAGCEPEINMGSVQVRVSKTSSVVEREYAEAVANLEGAIADEVQVVYTSIEPIVEEIQPMEDMLNLRGRLRMCAVIKNGEEPAYGVEKTVNFEEKIDFDGISPEMHLIPEMSVTSLKSSINANENGCEVVLSGIVEMCAIGEGNQSVELVLDGYLKEMPTDNSYENFSYTRLVSAEAIKSSHTAEIDRADVESEGMREVVFLTSTPKIEQIEKGEGRVTISGEVRYSGVVSEMIGDRISYTNLKFSSPFSLNVNCNCQNDDKTHVEVELHTQNTSATLDLDKLYATCSFEGTAVVLAEEKQLVLSEMTCLEEDEKNCEAAKITVYYPAPGDTLFEVAKRFRTSTLKLARDNNITQSVFSSDNPSGSLSGVKKLIVY